MVGIGRKKGPPRADVRCARLIIRSGRVTACFTLLCLIWLSCVTEPGGPASRPNVEAGASEARALPGLRDGSPSEGMSPVGAAAPRARRERPDRGEDTAVEDCVARHPTPVPHDIVPAFHGDSSFQMAIYKKTANVSDFVSASVRRWGKYETSTAMKLEQELSHRPNSVFLDVGANIGYFSLAMAAKGFKTYAVEPFDMNRRLIELSACLNPNISKKLVVVPFGLHTHNRTCELWQVPSTNLGDTHSLCDDVSGTGVFERFRSRRYEKVGTMKTTTLDWLVASGTIDLGEHGSSVMKMDVEGFEPFVVLGGESTFRQVPPRYITSEFSRSLMRNANKVGGNLPAKYLETMLDYGYDVFDGLGVAVNETTLKGRQVVFRLK